MVGRLSRLEPIAVEQHAADLYEANAADGDGGMWTYLAVGPFASPEDYRGWLEAVATSPDPLFFAIIDARTGRAVGLASYLRIDPANGVIEVGNLQFSPALQKSILATEAMYLMMRRAFTELGYRRYEWKCDRLNSPSMAAARRFGFAYEGTFRQAVVYKGRNRDTAWFSILDREWPMLSAAFEQWLAPDNFDADGQQRSRLSDLTRSARRSLPAADV
jgi:RimJ/RimL family protein N-acetyltransferase